MAKSIKKSRRRGPPRPPKPYPEFPLNPSPLGYWSKKVRGEHYRFGWWGRVVNGVLTRIEGDGWEDALREYKAQIDDIMAGRVKPGLVVGRRRQEADGLTIAALCNAFLTAKLRKKDSGEIGSRSFNDYRKTTDLLVAELGKQRAVESLTAADFEKLRADLASRWGPVPLGNSITRIKSVFRYGLDNGLIQKPVRYGSEFKKPGKAVLRRHKATNGQRMIEAADLRKLLDAAEVPIKAMILLGLNCGFGNNDCATLPLSAIDLKGGWIDFPRPKTGIERRASLWPETVAALKAALAERPKPLDKADADLALLMPSGRRWVRETERSTAGALSDRFAKLLKKCGLYREGVGFYALRHVFRTIADAARDPVAIDRIMGHADHTMGGHYRERIDDSRLKAVTDHVREWLFARAAKTEGGVA